MRALSIPAAVLILGCNTSPDVYVVNSPNDARKCAPDEGVFLTQDGKVAVCMPKHVAAFTMCATHIGAGNYEGTDSTETNAETGTPQVGFKAGHKGTSTKRLTESGSDAILRARATALRACLTVLCGGKDCPTIPKDECEEAPAPPEQPTPAPSGSAPPAPAPRP